MKALKIGGGITIILTVIVIGLILFIKFKSTNVVDKKNLEAAIDKQVKEYIADGNSYALVIGVIKDGKVLLKSYGSTVKNQTILPDSTTVFELASTSKLFTTSTLQLLVDRGEIKLDDHIQTFLKNKVQLPVIAQKTSLRHLATHLSGFPTLPNSFINKMDDDKDPYKDLVKQDIYDYLKSCEGKQKNGTFEYSNFGMGLLGNLMEQKTGFQYEQLVKEKLLNPLGMSQTFITVNNNNKLKIIQGYDENGKQTPVWTDHVLTGAGSHLSTGADMIKFIKANLSANASSISKSLIATHKQQLNGETGLGWILPSSTDKLLGHKDIVWHSGMSGGYASFIAIDKVNSYGLFVLSNKAVDPNIFGMKLTGKVRSQSWKP